MSTPPRHKWYQFGLREIFWLILIVASAMFAGLEARKTALLRRQIVVNEITIAEQQNYIEGLHEQILSLGPLALERLREQIDANPESVVRHRARMVEVQLQQLELDMAADREQHHPTRHRSAITK